MRQRRRNKENNNTGQQAGRIEEVGNGKDEKRAVSSLISKDIKKRRRNKKKNPQGNVESVSKKVTPPPKTKTTMQSSSRSSTFNSIVFVLTCFISLVLMVYGCMEMLMSYRTKIPSPEFIRKVKTYYRWYLDDDEQQETTTTATTELTILRKRIYQLHMDEETEAFVMGTWPMPYWKYYARKQLINWRNAFGGGMSEQDASAFVGGNPMYVLSSSQVDQLLGPPAPEGASETTTTTTRLLDIGSGDGAVTERFAHRVSHITCIEVSTGMQKLLLQKKWKRRSTTSVVEQPLCDKVLDELPSPDSNNNNQQYDLITMLNVLDRVHNPIEFLSKIKPLLKHDTGKLILAQVTPYKPSVATTKGWEQARNPFRPLLLRKKIVYGSKRIQEDASIWINEILQPNGWMVESVSKVPYLSRRHSFAPRKFAIKSEFVFVLSLSPIK